MTKKIASSPWVLEPKDGQKALLKLFCFPPAGAGAAIYRAWHKALSPDVAVYRIQPPGRETRFREDLICQLDAYLEKMLVELLPYLNGPFAFFGHSMGSLIAFSVAEKLRHDHGLLPEHIVVSAFRSPHAPPMKRIHELPSDDFIRELRETYDGIPDQLLNEPEILALTLPIVRADLAVVASHKYIRQAPLSCPISAFGGTDDKWVGESELSAWRAHTISEFNLTMFSGNHYYLNPPADELFVALRSILTQVDR